MAAPHGVRGWQYQERQEHAGPQASNHRGGGPRRHVGSDAGFPEQRQQAEHRRGDRHDQRANASGGAFDHRRVHVRWCVNAAFAQVPFERLVEVHDHHDAGLGGDARDRDEPDPHGRREVVVHEREQPHAAGDGKRQTGQDEERLRPPPHRQVQEHHHEDEREWDHVAEPGLHLREELILTRPLQPRTRQAMRAATRPWFSRRRPSRRGRVGSGRCRQTRSRPGRRSRP